MSGSVHLQAPGYLPTLFGGGGAVGDSLLATLYGQTPRAAGSANLLAALRQARSGETMQVSLVAAEPQVQREVTQFRQALASAKTPADLLNNPSALKVLLTANGLGDRLASTDLAKQALLSDPADPASLANRLPDTRWKSVAAQLAFAARGLANLRDPRALAPLTRRYAEALWRQSLDRTVPGLSNALDFLKRAASIVSADQILGDPALREVVTTVLAIPADIGFQALTAQENAIRQRIDVTRFADPDFAEHFALRYLIAVSRKEARSGGTGGGAWPPAAGLAV